MRTTTSWVDSKAVSTAQVLHLRTRMIHEWTITRVVMPRMSAAIREPRPTLVGGLGLLEMVRRRGAKGPELCVTRAKHHKPPPIG